MNSPIADSKRATLKSSPMVSDVAPSFNVLTQAPTCWSPRKAWITSRLVRSPAMHNRRRSIFPPTPPVLPLARMRTAMRSKASRARRGDSIDSPAALAPARPDRGRSVVDRAQRSILPSGVKGVDVGGAVVVTMEARGIPRAERCECPSSAGPCECRATQCAMSSRPEHR